MIAFDPDYKDSDLDADTERMTRVAAGDRHAFDELVRSNFDSTVRIISAMMGSHSQAEDLAQDVFLRIYRSRHRYLPTAKFSTFLGTVTRNVVLNAKRSLRRRRVSATHFVDDWLRGECEPGRVAAPTVQYDLDQNLDDQQAIAAVNQAIGLLPRRQQMAIQLVHFQGCSYVKAAQKMKTTRKAIKSLLGRGRNSMEQTLQERFGNRLEP